MKIGWVADYTVKENRGGGQQTNHEMVVEGRKRGHIIDYITPNTFSKKRINVENCINRYDLLILNRTMIFTVETKNLMIRRKYIRYEHDYDSVWADGLCKQICDNSLLNIFLSPLHYETYNGYYIKKYGCGLDSKKIYLQPSPVTGFKKDFSGDEDCEDCKNSIERIKNTVMWAGNLHKFKGIDNVIRYASKNKDLKFDFYLLKSMSQPEYINLIKKLGNARIVDEIPNNSMNAEYASHEYFIHLPVWAEPFGRTVLEAYLSGCKLITNNNVGMLSYNWDLNDYDKIVKMNGEACSNFWEKIENLKYK